MISGNTALIGLLGQPVSHSLSPVMHNAALAAMELDWCYLALPCETNQLRSVLDGLRAVNCRGLNITIPHKETVANLCNKRSQIAERLGAVNTLVPNEDNTWIGTNTDVAGFLAPLKNLGRNWKQNNAVVLGCGGSARAVVAGLQDLNLAKITVVGRRLESLNRFLQDLNQFHEAKNDIVGLPPQSELNGALHKQFDLDTLIHEAHLVVNTTPVGMNNNSNSPQAGSDMPLDQETWHNLKPGTILYDLIYNPRPTPWLSWGMQEGFECIDGLEMLIQQGAASLKLWTGRNDVPINQMRTAAESWLKH